MAQSAASPESLLWAHQLKREHGFLLQRMQEVEAKNQNQESRIKAAENSAKSDSNQELADLAKQVKALEDAAVDERLTTMEADVAQKLDDVQADSEAMTLQIAALQENEANANEEKREAVSKDKTLLDRIWAVEDGLKKYEKALERIGKPLDETRFGQIKNRLDELTKQVLDEGEKMKMLSESITALEAANAELVKANGKLEADLSKMAAKAASAQKETSKVPVASNAEPEGEATPGAEQLDPPKKKSHKWAGGGADRDIIRLGADWFGTPRSAAAASPQPVSTEQPKKRPPPPGPKKKPQPPHPKARASPVDLSTTPKKSHRWAGGGADRDIIQAGMSQFDGKRRRSIEDSNDGSKKKSHKWAGGGADKEIIQAGSPPATSKAKTSQNAEVVGKTSAKTKSKKGDTSAADSDKVVRAGKGWYEVARSPSVETNASSMPVKRKPGRPRKAHVTPVWTEEDLLTEARATRRSIHQPRDAPKSKKRGAGEAFGDAYDPPSKKSRAAASPDVALEDVKREEPKVFYSPPPEEHPVHPGTESLQDAKVAAASTHTSEPEQGPPKPRRRIIQLDELDAYIA